MDPERDLVPQMEHCWMEHHGTKRGTKNKGRKRKLVTVSFAIFASLDRKRKGKGEKKSCENFLERKIHRGEGDGEKVEDLLV